MESVKLHTDRFAVDQRIGPDMHDITDEIQAVVERSTIRQGIVSAFVVGSTGSITTIEFEPGVVQDLKEAIERVAPQMLDYAHERAWGDGNGHSHVQAALLGPSLTIPVRDGALRLGTWQQVVLINHDNRSRNRTVEISVLGVG